MTSALVPPISYHQQRLRHARLLLAAWLRRWGAYGGAFALVWAVGADSPLQVLGGALGALALPMLHAVQQPQLSATGLALLLATVLGYGVAGLVPVLATRPLWWPQRWAQAEAALPLPAAVLRGSDRRLIAWLLGPWLGLQVGGLLALLLNNPRLLHQGSGTALAGLLLAGAASAWAGLQHMRRVRQRGAQPAARPLRGAATVAGHSRAVLARARWPRVLLWWPLWRGVARRSGHALLAASVATPALAAGPIAAPGATGWWLAGLALCALGGTAWLRARSRDELAPLHAACRTLPLAPARVARAGRALALAPCALSLPLAGLALSQVGPRPLVAVAYLLWLAGSCVLESHPPPADAQHHALRWLLCLVVAVSLGSEVLP